MAADVAALTSLQLAAGGPRAPAMDVFGDPIEPYPPWFDPTAFTGPDFDADAYVAQIRLYVPLESLAAELRRHLAALRAELVGVINRDYADFVGLSARLAGVDAAAARMRAPLAELRDKAAAFRAAAAAALAALRAALDQRAAAGKARELLELLLDSSHVVTKVEKLLKELPGASSDSSSGEIDSLEKGILSSEGYPGAGKSARESQSILLERIASEMNRLNFYISHAQNLPFIESMEMRIKKAASSLHTSLERCFVDGLEHRDSIAIYNCLRAYAAIDNTNSAEEIFRTTVVAPLLQKIIPHSYAQIVAGVSSDELEEDYQNIMQCVEKDCKFILDISSSANSGLHVFDFLANSILKEVLFAIQKGKPSAFSPGKPREFLKNYRASLSFLDFLEGYCLSKPAILKFRSEAVYADFLRQWNVGVYFSLRFQEIAGGLDSVLSESINPVGLHGNQQKPHNLILKQSIKLFECLQTCWSDEVLVLSHCEKFLRLSLQLLSRYQTWLSHSIAARKSRSSGSSSTGDGESAVSSLEDFVYVMHDVGCLIEEISTGYLGDVLKLLGSCPAEVLDVVRHSILQATKSLKELYPTVLEVMIDGMVERSAEDLKQIRGMTATYRMTNKLPVRHSPYVSAILRPLKALLDNSERAVYLTDDSANELKWGFADKITTRYYEQASDVVNMEKKKESSLQKIRLGVQRRGGPSSDAADNNISDMEKICMQFFLDIQEYGRNLASMGIKAADIPSYRSLWQCVAPEDKQSSITF